MIRLNCSIFKNNRVVTNQDNGELLRNMNGSYLLVREVDFWDAILNKKQPYVSEVVIGAPYKITKNLLDHFNVHIVCHGATPIPPAEDGSSPYSVPQDLGRFKIIHSGNTMTTEKIVERIILHRLEFESRNQKKEKKEIAAYEAFQKTKAMNGNTDIVVEL